MHQKPSDQTITNASKRLFLTGGSGYVGRNLIRHFIGKDYEVVALARSAKAAETIRSLGAVPFEGHLLSDNLAQGMAGCRSVIHAAADTDHGKGTPQQVQTNLEGTRRLLEAARKAGITKAVYISSESILLDGKPLTNATESHPFPIKPAGRYSQSKGEAERVALSMLTDEFSVVAVRPRFIWGRDDSAALPHLVNAVKSGQFAWIEGGHYHTSITHIANACEGIERALEQGRGGQAYFITDGEPVEFRDFATRLLQTQGVAVPDKEIPRWLLRSIAIAGEHIATLSRGRIKAPLSFQEYATSAVEVTLDISKARNELGYEPIISQEEGLAELERGW